MPIVFPEEERNLYMSVATYEPILEPVLADKAIAFLKKAFAILEPYFTNPDLRYLAVWSPVGSPRAKARSLRHLKWEEVINDFPLEGFDLLIWKEKLRGTDRSPNVGGVAISGVDTPEIAAHLEFTVNPQEVLGKREIDPFIQRQVVELALETFAEVKGVVGYITVDYLAPSPYGTMSPYEWYVGLSYPWAARDFRRKVRGYYWGNLLSKGHIEMLGGEEILSKAPVYLVKRLENGYYLQLTEDINHIDRSKLAQLKEFLKPLLPEGYPQSPEYYENLPNFLL